MLYPLNWVLLLLILSMVLKSTSIKKKLRIWALIVFLVFSNPFIFSQILKTWEGKNEKLQLLTYDAAIVLGGYSSWNERHKLVSFNESSDRFIQAANLYHSGKVKRILLTGGSGSILKPEEKESEYVKDLLLNMDVDPEDILIESASRNTHENAIFCSDLLVENLGINKKFILITSAFHMRRAEACFAKTELQFSPLRVDFQIDDDDYTVVTYILPSATTLDKWQILMKEWIGYLVYWTRGYL